MIKLNSKDQTRLRSKIRQVWSWSVVHKETKERARIRRGWSTCNLCKFETPASNINVDHIVPFTPVEGFKSLLDWGPALVRMFDPSNHHVVCKPCHKVKTDAENKERRGYRYGRK